jgi:mono/diheme cytochrome c family protein
MAFCGMAGVVVAGAAALLHTPAEWDAVRPSSRVDRVEIDTNSPLVQKALRVFQGQSCSACHCLKGVWCYHGIPLEGSAEKYDPDTLRRFIRNPKLVDARAHMPLQEKITNTEIDAIASFLFELPRTQTNANSTLEHH